MKFLKQPVNGAKFYAVDGVVTIFSLIIANPQPSIELLTIRKINEPKTETSSDINADLIQKDVKTYLFKIQATFKPPMSGIYQFTLLDETVNNEAASDQFDILSKFQFF